MKSKILLIAILVIGQSILANTKVWTLEECVNYALENNISILQARNNILSNEQDVISAKGNFMPGISSNISGSMSIGKVELYQGEFADREFYSSSLGIGFSQTIFNGFRNINVLNQSKLTLEKNTSVKDINAAMRDAALHGSLVNQINYQVEPDLVSTDIIGNTCCAIYDSNATICTDDGQDVVLYIWYDNEFGYTKQVIRLAKQIAKVRRLTYY